MNCDLMAPLAIKCQQLSFFGGSFLDHGRDLLDGKGRGKREDDCSSAVRHVDVDEVRNDQFMGVGTKVDRKLVMFNRWFSVLRPGLSRRCKERTEN